MTEQTLKDYLKKLVLNFRYSKSFNELVEFWQKDLGYTSDIQFIMAVNEVINNPNQRHFPTIAEMKKIINATPLYTFAEENREPCKKCKSGLMSVDILHSYFDYKYGYTFAFACTCSTEKYPNFSVYKCNTCICYKKEYLSQYYYKNICIALKERDLNHCKFIGHKFKRYFTDYNN